MLAVVITLVAATGCGSEREPVRIDGSPGVAPLISALVEEYRVRNPAVAIELATGLGSAARIRAVEDGTIDVAMASHGVDTADIRRRGLAAHEIARTAVVLAVNQSVNVGGLLREQVCDIYSGRKPAWQLMGGAPGAIVPLMRPAEEVDAEVALEGIECLRGLEYGGSVSIRERADEMAGTLASTPGAIGVTSMTYVQQSGGRIRALALDGIPPTPENVASGAYALTRRAILVTKAVPPPAVDSLLAFIRSADGERVISANGSASAP